MDIPRFYTIFALIYSVFVSKTVNTITISEHPGQTCAVKYNKIGCYKDKTAASKRALSKLLFQDRYKGKTYSGQMINWKNWSTYLPELICRCAMASSSKGYVFFGIQFYGECWSGSETMEHITKYGTNPNCVNTEFQLCEKGSDEPCAGKNHKNYLYEIVQEFPGSPEVGSGDGGPGIEPQE